MMLIIHVQDEEAFASALRAIARLDTDTQRALIAALGVSAVVPNQPGPRPSRGKATPTTGISPELMARVKAALDQVDVIGLGVNRSAAEGEQHQAGDGHGRDCE